MALHLGAGGFRGVLGLDLSAGRVRALARGAGEWIHAEGRRAGARPLVVLAHDTRWFGSRMVALAAQVLADLPLRVRVAGGVTPTPVVVHHVREEGASGALVFTASHNPPTDHGIKVVGPDGLAPPAAVLRALAARPVAGGRLRVPARGPRACGCSPRESYLAALDRVLGGRSGARCGPRVFYDPLHGAGAGTVEPALERSGARLVWCGGRPDPDLGGRAPDPVPPRLSRLAAAVRAGTGVRLGLATDGDADRFGVVDETGRVLSETEAAALLIEHLASSGRIPAGSAVALSPFVGGLAERTARHHGLRVLRRPPGFRHLGAALVAGEAAAAADENGGFAWAEHAVDKDGILGCALAAEAVALAGEGPGRLLRRIRRRVGASHAGRASVAATPDRVAGLAALRSTPPSRVFGEVVRGAETDLGLLLRLGDGFLGLRRSGTEPRVRIYADAPSRRQLLARLRDGVRLLDAVGARGASAVDARPEAD